MYFVIAAFLLTAVGFAQGTITGSVVAGDFGDPLPGANILVQGTTNGVAADFDGNFTLEVSQNSGTLVISYIGFISKKVNYTAVGTIGSISLNPDAQELE